MADQNPSEPPDAPGRLALGKPIGIVDIGSNSVRLVAYEGLARAPTPIFNDKMMCGLGRGVLTTGELPQDGVDKALAALRRFRILCDIMGIGDVRCVATAAARDAQNGKAFLAAAREAIGAPIELLSGKREAELSALGVVSGFHNPDGVVGDMGGGSLEFSDVRGANLGRGATTPLGGLALIDASGKNPKKAMRIAHDALENCKPLDDLRGRAFYAVGGTWRALARLHMRQRNYPLNVMHGYVIPARDAADFVGLVERVSVDALISIEAVAAARRPLLVYGAIVLDEIIRRARPSEIVISAHGLREGLLFERLDKASQRDDPLIAAANDLNFLRSRAPRHGAELCAWTDLFMEGSGVPETADDMRLRRAACLLADINWRAHPDYRGEQAMNIIANAAFVGVDHPGRAFLALASAYRHLGPDADVSPQIRTLASPRSLDRAHILGALMRVGYQLSAAMPGVLPHCPVRCRGPRVVLTVDPRFKDLVNDRLSGRLKQLARLVGREPHVEAAA